MYIFIIIKLLNQNINYKCVYQKFNVTLFWKTFVMTFYLIKIEYFMNKNRMIKVILKIDIDKS